jgi:3-deoxy-manno-octulosonate cytidylyltransferase (CMP-KDO synthetase)
MNNLKIAAVIPARMASTRYPGKPLIEIEGLPMIEHVRRRVLLCEKFSDVVVATCDNEIRVAIEEYGGTVVMTSDQHIMASDRVAEAVEILDCSHVVNVQGDEILVMPDDLERMLIAINARPEIEYWNAIAPIEKHVELADTAIVKCVVSIAGKILYCARTFSHLNLEFPFEPIHKILGILGYSKKSVLSFSKLSRTSLETTQSIDQSRIIEHDISLMSIPFKIGYPGINDAREEKMVRDILKTDEEQSVILTKILS